MGWYRDELVKKAHYVDFPVHKPYFELTEEQKETLWKGNQYFMGIDDFFKDVENQSYKIQYRVMLARYRGKTTCPDCHGRRLRKEANYVKINGKSITDLSTMPISELQNFFINIKLSESESSIAERLLVEIRNRIGFLMDTPSSARTSGTSRA